ncbi:MAG: transposase family protein [Deltaproteobacteria bacterium]|nr:transposase family protein [Deltaproteobacteria bacterium]
MRIEKGGRVEKAIFDLGRTEKRYICSGCGKVLDSYYDKASRQVRHLHLWRYVTVLRFDRVRVECPQCGVKVEVPGFLDRGRRETQQLAHQVSELCKVMDIEDVATFEHLHWQTVKDIDKKAIEKAQSERSLEGITVLGVDEIAVGRGHNY